MIEKYGFSAITILMNGDNVSLYSGGNLLKDIDRIQLAKAADGSYKLEIVKQGGERVTAGVRPQTGALEVRPGAVADDVAAFMGRPGEAVKQGEDRAAARLEADEAPQDISPAQSSDAGADVGDFFKGGDWQAAR